METLRDFARKRQFCVGQIWVVEMICRTRDGSWYPEDPFCELYESGKDLFESIEKDGIVDYNYKVDKHSSNTLIQLAIWRNGNDREF